MTYAQLPSMELVQKLMATSFGEPNANWEVFKWCKAVQPMIEFRENERIKLVQKYGESHDGKVQVKSENMKLFADGFSKIMNAEVPDFKPLPLGMDNFHDGRCFYSMEERMWLNAKDLETISNLVLK